MYKTTFFYFEIIKYSHFIEKYHFSLQIFSWIWQSGCRGPFHYTYNNERSQYALLYDGLNFSPTQNGALLVIIVPTRNLTHLEHLPDRYFLGGVLVHFDAKITSKWPFLHEFGSNSICYTWLHCNFLCISGDVPHLCVGIEA